MLSQNNNALGIIFPNSYDNTVPELVTERAMASIPFAGRYRMVDFVLSSMANCGISNVSIRRKRRAEYTKRNGVCFETQYFPNSINIPSFESCLLKAGDTFTSTTIYKFC